MMTTYLVRMCSVVIIATMVVVLAEKPPQNESCDTKKLDKCAQKLIMISDPTFVFPINMEQMNRRCKEIKPLEQCVKTHSQKCLASTTRQSIQVLAFGITRTNKNYCHSTKRKESFITIGKCANRVFKDLYGFMDDMNRAFHAARTYKEKKLRIPMACCNYYRFKDRVVELISKHCPGVEGEVERLIDGYAQDILNLLCGDYTEDSDKCHSVVAKTPKWTKPLKWQAFLNPLAEILDSLD